MKRVYQNRMAAGGWTGGITSGVNRTIESKPTNKAPRVGIIDIRLIFPEGSMTV
jgi:hypothetical protein